MIFSKRRSVKGFTLTELIVVIAIIGLLLAVLMPTMSGYYWKSRVRSANANAKMVYNAMQTEV
ncbi:MAG: type II secretion system protein, partial [Oscillospiraceae bacterium]|nr:type II secretion system protein [Oscillospiraceae bacterium]